MDGYTADTTDVQGAAVNFGDDDLTKTVTYSANAQTATITYVDDTTGKTLKNDTADGKFNQAISFGTDPATQIASYEGQGYKLVSNDFESGAKFASDNAKNNFTVHLTHATKTASREDTVSQTIHYVYTDGTKAADDNVQTLTFTENGTTDEVTGKTVWTPSASQSFTDVTSPVLNGYTADQTNVQGAVVNFGDDDLTKTVTYSANAQTATITYVDDTTGKTLKTDTADGKFNQAISFGTDPVAQINTYEGQGYKLVSNDFESGDKFASDNAKNNFTVHLTHNTKTTTREDTVNQTIHYIYTDGTKAADDNVQTLTFTENGTTDEVTGKTTWTPSAAQSFTDVASPVLDGYTADQTNVQGTAVNFGDEDLTQTVTYSANAQTATITYVDDTTGKTLKTDMADGKFNQAISFSTDPATQISNYESQGYKLVSNDFESGAKFASDNSNNNFTVHLTHATKATSREDTVSQTIHYVYTDGTKAAEDNVQTLTFTENGTTDEVTGKTTWTPSASQSFTDVTSPVLDGYTADQTNVQGATVNFGDEDLTKTVNYDANAQTATITYVDDTTGETLKTDTADGKFNQAISFGTDPATQISDYEGQGYKLVSSDFQSGAKFASDNAKNNFTVHLEHAVTPVNDSKTVTETIHYVFTDGSQAAADNTQTVTFSRTGEQDAVTNEKTWGAWSQDSQSFAAVTSPSLDGYTADKQAIASQTITPTSGDIEQTVTYTATADPDFDTHYKNADTKPTDDTTDTTNTTDTTTTTPSTTPTGKDQSTGDRTTQTTGSDVVTPTGKNIHGATLSTDSARRTNAATTTDTTSAGRAASQRLPQTGNADSTALAGLGFASLLTMFGLLGSKKKKQD